MRGMVVGFLVGVLGVSCERGSGGDDQLAERFTKAAAFLESKFQSMEIATKRGEYCHPLIDGYTRYRVQSLGSLVAKDVRDFEAYFDFATIVLDVYKTPVGDRFNALALKYKGWKEGPYANAIESCQACMRDGRSDDGPLRPDPAACRTP